MVIQGCALPSVSKFNFIFSQKSNMFEKCIIWKTTDRWHLYCEVSDQDTTPWTGQTNPKEATQVANLHSIEGTVTPEVTLTKWWYNGKQRYKKKMKTINVPRDETAAPFGSDNTDRHRHSRTASGLPIRRHASHSDKE